MRNELKIMQVNPNTFTIFIINKDEFGRINRTWKKTGFHTDSEARQWLLTNTAVGRSQPNVIQSIPVIVH